MNDLYPSASPRNLQNLLSYDDYEVIPTDEEIQALQLNETPPENGISAEAFFYGIEGAFGKLPRGEQFGYEQHGANISLLFSGMPSFPFMLAMFSVVQNKLVALGVQGVNEVTFNAGKDDEVVNQNVMSILQPNQSNIPLVLQELQTYHLNKSRSTEG